MNVDFKTVVLTAVFIFSFLAIKVAKAECDPLPEVTWWGNLTHASIYARVMNKHEGDWDAYIAKWESQGQKIERIYFNDGAASINNGDVKLSGFELEEYAEHVSNRVEVTRCLAGLANGIGLRPGNRISAKAASAFLAGLKAFKANEYKKALSHLKPLAEAGYAKAQNALAYMNRKGIGVEADHQKALFWYKESAKLGDATGQFSYGEILRKTGITHEEQVKARAWLRKAANQGNEKAQVSLGNMYYRGDGVDENLPRASFWYNLAKDKSEFAQEMSRRIEKKMSDLQLKKADYLKDKWLTKFASNNS